MDDRMRMGIRFSAAVILGLGAAYGGDPATAQATNPNDDLRPWVTSVVISWGNAPLRVYSDENKDELKGALPWVLSLLRPVGKAQDAAPSIPAMKDMLLEAESVGCWVLVKLEKGMGKSAYARTLVIMDREGTDIYWGDADKIVKTARLAKGETDLSDRLSKLFSAPFEPKTRVTTEERKKAAETQKEIEKKMAPVPVEIPLAPTAGKETPSKDKP